MCPRFISDLSYNCLLQNTRRILETFLRTQIVISAKTFHSCYDFLFHSCFLFLWKVSWLEHHTCGHQTSPNVIIRSRDHGLPAPAHPSQLVCDEDLIIWRVWRVTRVVMWGVTGAVWRCQVSLSSEDVMWTLSEIHGGHEDCAVTLMQSLASSLWRCDMSTVTGTIMCGLEWSQDGHWGQKCPSWQQQSSGLW